MIDRFASNVVKALNQRHPNDPWAQLPRLKGKQPWVRIYRQRWYRGNNHFLCWVQIHCVMQGQRGNPPFQILLARVKPNTHWKHEDVRFGNATDAGDKKAVLQCVKYAEDHAEEVEREIATIQSTNNALLERHEPRFADEGSKGTADNELGLEPTDIPVIVPPDVPPDVATNEQKPPEPPEDPCGQIAGLFVQIDRLVKEVYQKDPSARDYENVPNHFVCRIPYRWPKGATKILISGMNPKFNRSEARVIHNIEDSIGMTQGMDFVHHG